MLGSSRSPFTTSTPRFSSVSADLLAGLRLTTRTLNWPEASNPSTTPPPCAPVPPMTVMICLVMSVSAPFLPAIVLALRKFGGSAEFPEQLDQRRALGPGEPSRHKIHRRFVTGEYFRRLLLSSRREPDDAGPAIALVRFARHKAARLESVHGGGYRSAGELDASANLVDGLWSFVEQHLHDREVREADLGRLNAARRQAL